MILYVDYIKSAWDTQTLQILDLENPKIRIIDNVWELIIYTKPHQKFIFITKSFFISKKLIIKQIEINFQI